MERIKKKIQSQSGASFLFALLAFLVAAMVSVTIVAAAVTTVKRVNSDREAQQTQLTLISAARLVRDEMKKTKYSITTITTETDGSEPPESTPPIPKLEGTFAAEMQDAVTHVNKDSTRYYNPNPASDDPDSKAFTIQADGLENVNVSFAMKEGDEKYCLVFAFSIEETGETLFLEMTGHRREDTSFEDITNENGGIIGRQKEVKEEYTWSEGIISGIGDTNESKTEKQFR